MSGREYEVILPIEPSGWIPAPKHPIRKGFYEWREGVTRPLDNRPPIGEKLFLEYWNGKCWVETHPNGKLVTTKVGNARGAKPSQVHKNVPRYSYWRGIQLTPYICDDIPEFRILDAHRSYLWADFRLDVSIDHYREEERQLLNRFGALLNWLTNGHESMSKHETRFVDMCLGKVAPQGPVESVWKKYRLDLMYLIARKMEADSARNGEYVFDEYKPRFIQLAYHGHNESQAWVRKECPKLTDAERIGLDGPINLIDIFPEKKVAPFMMRLSGSGFSAG